MGKSQSSNISSPILRTHSIRLERNPESRILQENEATWTMQRKTVVHARK